MSEMAKQLDAIPIRRIGKHTCDSCSESHTTAGVASIPRSRLRRNYWHPNGVLPAQGQSMPGAGSIGQPCFSSSFLVQACVLRLLLNTLPPDLAREGCSFLAADKRVPEGEKEQNSTELSGSYRAAIMGALYSCGNSPSKPVQEEPAACPPSYILR